MTLFPTADSIDWRGLRKAQHIWMLLPLECDTLITAVHYIVNSFTLIFTFSDSGNQVSFEAQF